MSLSQKPETGIELADKAESFIVSAIVFIQRFLWTVGYLTFRPLTFLQTIKEEKYHSVFLRPETFLTLITYVNIKAFRIGATILLTVMWGPKSCGRVETKLGGHVFGEDWSPLWSQEGLPTFEDIVWVGLPMLLGAFVISWFARVALVKGGSGHKAIEGVILYTFGLLYLELIFWLLIAFLKFVLSLNGAHLHPYLDFLGEGYFLGGVLGILIIWPMVILTLSFHKFVSVAECRIQSPFWGRCYLIGVAAMVILAAAALNAVLVYPSARAEVMKLVTEPLIALRLMNCSAGTGQVIVNVLAQNNSQSFFYVPPRSEVDYGNWQSASNEPKGKVLLMNKDFHSVPITLSPGQPTLLTLQFDSSSFDKLKFHESNTLRMGILDSRGKKRLVKSRIYVGVGEDTCGEKFGKDSKPSDFENLNTR